MVRDRLAKTEIDLGCPLRALFRDVRPKDPAAELKPLHRVLDFVRRAAGFQAHTVGPAAPGRLAGLDELPPLLRHSIRKLIWTNFGARSCPIRRLLEELGAGGRALLEANGYLPQRHQRIPGPPLPGMGGAAGRAQSSPGVPLHG